MLSFFLNEKIIGLANNHAFFGRGDSLMEVPMKLIERNQSTLWIAMIGLAFSFILLALSKIGTSRLTYIFSKIILKNNSILKTINEEYSLTNFSSFILVLNFILTTSILTYLTFLHVNIHLDSQNLLLLPIFPTYIFLWPLIWFFIVGFITKEPKVFNENKKNAVILSQIMGFVFSFILLIWTFNLKWSKYFMLFFLIVVFIVWVFKVLRGIIFSFQHHVAWYYIILYFCTLEILPLLIVYSIYQR